MKNKFTFIDLFAGIGGLRIPFEELGGRCVFTSEQDKFAQQTYEANFKEKPSGDITKIEISDIPAHDLILAGFPCQPFSYAGLKRGFDDIRGTLFASVAMIAKYHRPKVIFLENVKGFKSHDKGRTFETVRRVIEEDLGYKLFYKALNARNFGLPQNRDRFFMIAFSEGSAMESFNWPEPLMTPTRVGDILEKEPVDLKYTISDRLWKSHKRRKRQHQTRGNGFGYSIFNSSSEYTSTISARYYKDGSEILIEQPDANPRKLTPREASRLQGFPSDFIIPVSDVQAYKQFGNAVPVPVIRILAKHVMDASHSLLTSDDQTSEHGFIEQQLSMLSSYGLSSND